jgi:hypothetical protein
MCGETDAGDDAQNKAATAEIPRPKSIAAPPGPILAPPGKSFPPLVPHPDALQQINTAGAAITDIDLSAVSD